MTIFSNEVNWSYSDNFENFTDGVSRSYTRKLICKSFIVYLYLRNVIKVQKQLPEGVLKKVVKKNVFLKILQNS